MEPQQYNNVIMLVKDDNGLQQKFLSYVQQLKTVVLRAHGNWRLADLLDPMKTCAAELYRRKLEPSDITKAASGERLESSVSTLNTHGRHRPRGGAVRVPRNYAHILR